MALTGCGGSSSQQGATPLSFASSGADYSRQVQEMYVAYYGRPADPGGQQYWANRVAEAGGNLSAIIQEFGTSAEAQSLYGSLPPAEAITALYRQLFNRDPDPEGLKYYQDGLLAGRFTLASIAADVFYGASPGGDDARTLAIKVERAQVFTEVVKAESSSSPYSGNGVAASARKWLSDASPLSASAVAQSARLALSRDCIAPWKVTTKNKTNAQVQELQKRETAKGFGDKIHYLNMSIWNPAGLDITVQMEGCVENGVLTAKYDFDVPCCKPGSHASPHVAHGWSDFLHAFDPTFSYMGKESPRGLLPVRFDGLPSKLIMEYDVSNTNENGYWHLTSEVWAYALNLDRTWRCCDFLPQPMDIHFWGTPEMKANDKVVYSEYFKDYLGKTWGLTKVSYWGCDGNCTQYEYSVYISLINGTKKEVLDLVPVFKRIVELGWVRPDYGVARLNIGTEILSGKAEITINKFQARSE